MWREARRDGQSAEKCRKGKGRGEGRLLCSHPYPTPHCFSYSNLFARSPLNTKSRLKNKTRGYLGQGRGRWWPSLQASSVLASFLTISAQYYLGTWDRLLVGLHTNAEQFSLAKISVSLLQYKSVILIT